MANVFVLLNENIACQYFLTNDTWTAFWIISIVILIKTMGIGRRRKYWHIIDSKTKILAIIQSTNEIISA